MNPALTIWISDQLGDKQLIRTFLLGLFKKTKICIIRPLTVHIMISELDLTFFIGNVYSCNRADPFFFFLNKDIHLFMIYLFFFT